MNFTLLFVFLRFWGKLFGIKQDYFVLESELTDEDYEKRIEVVIKQPLKLLKNLITVL